MLRRHFMKILGFSFLTPLIARNSSAQTPAKTIFLHEGYVAGYQYHQGMKPEIEASLRVGQEVYLLREPENSYDAHALAVMTANGHKLGYVPRDVNTVPAAIADQDVKLYAVISAIEATASPWERLTIRSFVEI